ncbi:hypothetical protein J6590_030048 [Homalodisca vitripennis]|nr:hypothetical protein J6590_030048 [Homalodisca vitripennis]
MRPRTGGNPKITSFYYMLNILLTKQVSKLARVQRESVEEKLARRADQLIVESSGTNCRVDL